MILKHILLVFIVFSSCQKQDESEHLKRIDHAFLQLVKEKSIQIAYEVNRHPKAVFTAFGKCGQFDSSSRFDWRCEWLELDSQSETAVIYGAIAKRSEGDSLFGRYVTVWKKDSLGTWKIYDDFSYWE